MRLVKRIGVVDTTFARYDMAASAIDELKSLGTGFRVERVTVPGVKDLPVACQKLIRERDCDIVMALGMPGSKDIDKVCAHEASTGLINVQLANDRHIIEVFVHEDEGEDEGDLARLMDRRARDHARSAYDMLFRPAEMTKRAGLGVRQGREDAGSVSKAGGGSSQGGGGGKGGGGKGAGGGSSGAVGGAGGGGKGARTGGH
jgi:riboflavin synthase